MRPFQSAEALAVADFLDGATLIHRWLVAFFRNLGDLPLEAAPYWSLWVDPAAGGRGSRGFRAVLAHSFHTATTYAAIADEFDARELEGLLERELLPERLVGDSRALESWKLRSPELFSRVRRHQALAVLSLRPADLPQGLSPGTGFRPAVPEDEPDLRDFERSFAREMGEEDPESDLASLIARHMAFVFEEEGRVAGSIRSNLPDGRYVHVGGLFVRPEFRGRGIGLSLLAGLCQRIHRDRLTPLLDVDRRNAPALATYKQAGFREVGGGEALFFAEDAFGVGR